MKSPSHSLLYHLLMAVGLAALIGWFALMRELGFMTWVTAQGPTSHTGAMNVLAVMIWMTPGFLVWKYYVRWLHRRLNVQGRYYEDSYYTAAANKSADEPTPDTENTPRKD